MNKTIYVRDAALWRACKAAAAAQDVSLSRWIERALRTYLRVSRSMVQ